MHCRDKAQAIQHCKTKCNILLGKWSFLNYFSEVNLMKTCKKYYTSNKNQSNQSHLEKLQLASPSLLYVVCSMNWTQSIRHSSTHKPANSNNNLHRGQQFNAVLNSLPRYEEQCKKGAISSLSFLCKSLHYGNLQQHKDKQRVILYGKEKQIVFLFSKKPSGVSRTSSTRQMKRQTQRDPSSSAIQSLPASLS